MTALHLVQDSILSTKEIWNIVSSRSVWVEVWNRDPVIFSHFIAINAVIGGVIGDDRLLIRSLDNCSITVFERDATGSLSLVHGGHEADTLIR